MKKTSFIGRLRAAGRAFSSTFFEGAQVTNRQRARATIIQDSKRALTDWDRQQMLSSGRQLFGNYGAARAPVTQLARYAIGNAWNPVFNGSDKKFGAAATEYLREWMKICDIRGSPFNFKMGLYLTSLAVDRDGDVGVILTESESGYPQIQYVPGHRIANGGDDAGKVTSGKYRGLEIYCGVISNPQGRAVAYRVMRSDEGLLTKTPEFDDIPARDMCLIFAPEWHDQGRGITAYAPAIIDLQDAQDTQFYEKRGVKARSAVALMEFNGSGDEDSGALHITASPSSGTPTAFIEDFEGGAVRKFKAGSGEMLKALESNTPSPAWHGLMEHTLRNVYAAMDWPFELAWDVSKIGGANIRGVFARAGRTVEARQDLLNWHALRTVSWVCAKAMKRGDLPKSDDWWRWGFRMPAKLTVDVGREAQQNRADVAAGLRSLEEDAGERGDEWLSMRGQIEQETRDLLERAQALSKEFGVTLEFAINLLQQRNPNGTTAPATAPAPEPEEKSKTGTP